MDAEGEKPANASDPIAELLRASRVIAIVGLSSNRMRASNGVAHYLQRAGYKIIPVNPNETEVLGERAFARLEDIEGPVDIVDIFRRSEFVAEIVSSAIALREKFGLKAIWMQEGVVDETSAERARGAGLFVVMNHCIYKEHARRFR